MRCSRGQSQSQTFEVIKVNQHAGKSLTPRLRFIIGILALVGFQYADVERVLEVNVSYSYFRYLAKRSEAMLNLLFPVGREFPHAFLEITENFIRRCVLGVVRKHESTHPIQPAETAGFTIERMCLF